MYKYQLKEKALLLGAYSFLLEAKKYMQEVSLKEKTALDMEFERLFKKLSNIKESITTKKVEKFFFKRIPQDKAIKGVDIVTIALTLMYLHKHFVEKKDFTFTESVEEILEALREQSQDDKEMFNNSLLFAVDLFKSIYPDKAGLLEFRKILGKEPFNLLINN